jgi:hypothetical protein
VALRELMKESWGAETSTENRETVDPLIVSLEKSRAIAQAVRRWLHTAAARV